MFTKIEKKQKNRKSFQNKKIRKQTKVCQQIFKKSEKLSKALNFPTKNFIKHEFPGHKTQVKSGNRDPRFGNLPSKDPFPDL